MRLRLFSCFVGACACALRHLSTLADRGAMTATRTLAKLNLELANTPRG